MSNKSIISVSKEENQQWVIITLLPSSRGNFPSSITLSADGEMRTPLYLDIDILENNMAEQVYNYVWLLNHIPQEKRKREKPYKKEHASEYLFHNIVCRSRELKTTSLYTTRGRWKKMWMHSAEYDKAIRKQHRA